MRYVIGIIAGVTPVTNPTSTTMFKSLIAAKTRNVIYSLKMMVIGVILIYECYIIRQKKR